MRVSSVAPKRQEKGKRSDGVDALALCSADISLLCRGLREVDARPAGQIPEACRCGCNLLKRLAPQVGLEPTTLRLTAGFCSFCRNLHHVADGCRRAPFSKGVKNLPLAGTRCVLLGVAASCGAEKARKRQSRSRRVGDLSLGSGHRERDMWVVSRQVVEIGSRPSRVHRRGPVLPAATQSPS